MSDTMPHAHLPRRDATGCGRALRRCAGVLAATLALAGALPAMAADGRFTLQGVTDSGPLAGVAFSGSFAYDAQALDPQATRVELSAFALLFAGATYNLASADAPPAAVFDRGLFLGLDYADVDSSDAALRPLVAFQPGYFAFDGQAQFAYQGAAGLGGWGSYSVTVVPEPASLALMLAGLLLVCRQVRRPPAKPGACRSAGRPGR